MQYSRTLGRLAVVFGLLKAMQGLIIVFVPCQFDVSSSILLQKYSAQKAAMVSFHTASPAVNSSLSTAFTWVIEKYFEKLVAWDAVYFSDLFVNDLQFEHQYVFCPLWWRMVRCIPVGHETSFYGRLIGATLLANTFHFAAAVVLYCYTHATFEKARIFSPRRMAMAASVLFICSPAAAFMTAPYSESAASFCSFMCLYMREISVEPLGGRHVRGKSEKEAKHHLQSFGEIDDERQYLVNSSRQWFPAAQKHGALYLLSGVFAALAFGLRANCLLLGIIYLYDLYAKPGLPRGLPLLAGSMLGAAFAAVQAHGYVGVCYGTGRGEWCDSKVPSLFAYAQAHYWNNGFLRYWTLGNVPNFLFAAPTVLMSTLSVRYFAYMYPVAQAVPLLVVNGAYILLQCLFWHVQIVTRVHTFLPIVYWFVAGLVTQDNANGRKWAPVALAYFAVWNVFQVALYAAFLPPA